MNKTLNEVKDKIEGMLYHMKDLSSYMCEHRDDEFFNTENGRKFQIDVAMMMGTHAKILAGIMCGAYKDKNAKNEETGFNIEELLFGSMFEKPMKDYKNGDIDFEELLADSINKGKKKENEEGT